MKNEIREFTTTDWYGWQGCECFADNSKPLISEGDEGILVISGSNEKDGRAVVCVYFGDDGSDWGFKLYVNKECALKEAEFLTDLLDVKFDKKKWQNLGFETVS